MSKKSKNHCYRYHIVPSSPRHWAVLQFAVVCFASAPYEEPLNDGAYAAIAVHEMSDACQKESTTQTWLLATNCVRVSALHEHVCALNSQVLDREWGSPQFCEQIHQNKLLTPGKRVCLNPVLCEPCVVCCVLCVGCCWLLFVVVVVVVVVVVLWLLLDTR